MGLELGFGLGPNTNSNLVGGLAAERAGRSAGRRNSVGLVRVRVRVRVRIRVRVRG